MQNLQYHAILVSDSRARGFATLDQGEDYDFGYQAHYVCIPGAKIRDLKDNTLALINDIPPTNTKIIVKIAAGINNLTRKIDHKGSYEIAPSTATASSVLAELVNLKHSIQEIRPDAYISYMTIPPVNFLQQLTYWTAKGKLQHPIHNEAKRRRFQCDHELIINDINKNINALNHGKQNNIQCQTASWHSVVLRRQRGQNRLIVSALTDGIHGSDNTKKKWHQSYHQAVQKEIAIIKGYPLKLNTWQQ